MADSALDIVAGCSYSGWHENVIDIKWSHGMWGHLIELIEAMDVIISTERMWKRINNAYATIKLIQIKDAIVQSLIIIKYVKEVN